MALKRVAAALVLTAGVAWATSSVALAVAPSPSPTPQVCDQLPVIDQTGFAARAGCELGRAAVQAAGGAASQIGQAAAGAAESDFTSWLANGAAWVVQGVTQEVIGNSTTPSLAPAQAGVFAEVYGRVVGVALSLSVLLVLIGIIEATLTQRPGALRRVVAGIAASGIGLGAIPVGTAILVRITDDLSTYVTAGPSQEVAAMLRSMVRMLAQSNPGDGAAMFAVTAVGLMLGGSLLWLELVIRASLIYVFLGVAPLACAAVQWPRLEGVLRQVLFGGLALILSKLVIAIVLAVGFAVLSDVNGLQALIAGMFILLIAALMPFATARILPIAAEEMALSHQGRLRGLVAAGVGTTARVVMAVGSGGLSAARGGGIDLAPAMGQSSARGSGSGPSGPPADSGGGPGGGPRPVGPGPGRPGAARRVASAASSSGSSASSATTPEASSSGRQNPARPQVAQPRRRPRGPEPPRTGGGSQAT
jgi:type IV secretion system protein TrbL